MFDVYLQEQTIDPDTRNRLLGAMVLATGALVLTGSLAIVVERMSVSAVSAPKLPAVLTLYMGPTPPPAPDPPRLPEVKDQAAGQASSDDLQPDATPKAPELDGPPLETASDPTPRKPTGPRKVPGTGTGTSPIPGLDPIKTGTCIAPPCGDKKIGVPRNQPPKSSAPAVEPLSQVKARARFTPDPDSKALAKTKTGMGTRRSGSTTVSFCIDTAGKVFDAKTKRGFGDLEVDTIARDTVRRWRFAPMVVGGRAQQTCSQVTFRIQFD